MRCLLVGLALSGVMVTTGCADRGRGANPSTHSNSSITEAGSGAHTGASGTNATGPQNSEGAAKD